MDRQLLSTVHSTVAKALMSVYHVATALSTTASALCGFCSLEAGTQARVVVPPWQQQYVQGWDIGVWTQETCVWGSVVSSHWGMLCFQLLSPRIDHQWQRSRKKLENYCLRANSRLLYQNLFTHTQSGWCPECSATLTELWNLDRLYWMHSNGRKWKRN